MERRREVWWWLAASAFGIAALTGCTTTIALQPPRGYLDFGYRGGEGRVVRVPTPFVDRRTRGECPGDIDSKGRVVKGKAMIQSAEDQLRCSDAPPTWFAERLATALRGAGYTVLGPDEAGPGDILEIRGTVRSVAVEVITTIGTGIFEADVSLELHASSTSGLVASRGFFAKSSVSTNSRSNLSMATLQESLDDAATRAVRDMTAAILSLTNRYPTIAVEPLASERTAAMREDPP